MQQNAMLIELVQVQQKKIEELMTQSQKLVKAMSNNQANNSSSKKKDEGKMPGKKQKWCKHSRQMIHHKKEKGFAFRVNKDKRPALDAKNARSVKAGTDKQGKFWGTGSWMVVGQKGKVSKLKE